MNVLPLFGDQLVLRANPANRRALARAAARGDLSLVLPATYARPGTATRPAVRAAAIHAHDPSAVLTGASAAALHVRRGHWPDVLTFASPRRWRVGAPWLRATRTTIPREHVRLHPIPHVDPGLALLQLAEVEGSRVLDRALRERRVRTSELLLAADALRGSPGNAARRRLALESSANPWSSPERSSDGWGSPAGPAMSSCERAAGSTTSTSPSPGRG